MIVRNKRGCNPARHWSTTAPTRTAALADFITMESKTILITPEIAESLLTSNHSNRPFNKANLDYLKLQLQSEGWMITHQGIAISENGTLLDGQHRLRAVAETGISVEMLVTSSVPENVFSVLDTGRMRGGADTLSINGATNTHCLAAGIKSYIFCQEFPHVKWNSRSKCNTDILKQYQLDKKGWQWATSMAHAHSLKGVLVPGAFCCLIYLAMQKGHKESTLETFTRNVQEGFELKKGNPILAFRNKCIVTTTQRRNTQQWVANYIKLFNYSFKDEQLVIFKDQAFPPMPSVVKAY